MTNSYTFPEDTDPIKGQDWYLKYAKAAWGEWNASDYTCLHKGATVTDSVSANSSTYYDTIAMYMQGRQRIEQYKPLMGIDENATDTWMNLDWTILPVMPKQLRVCNGILNKLNYKVGFQPLDQMAVDAKNKFFSEMKARLEMRSQIMEADPQNGEAIIKQLGLDKSSQEPGDMEELEMMAMYTYKHIAAIEMEEDVSAVLAMNKIEWLRKDIRKNLLYYGIAGYKDYIDSNGALKIRSVDPRCIMVSPCIKSDFSDAKYIGEVLQMNVVDFAEANQGIPQSKLIEIANQFVGKYGNPTMHCTSYNECRRFTIPVLDLELFSIEDRNYEVNTTKFGSTAVVRAPINKYGESFVRNRIKVAHKVKWVIGTEIIWDYGLCTDIKRAKKQLSEIIPSYHIIAPMMSNMRVQSIGQLVQPILDQIQLSWLKYQKAKSEAKSQGLHIEMGSLEDVNYGKGGKAMKPSELVDLFEQKNILLWRRKGRFGDADNGKPIEVVPGTGMDDVLNWFQALQNEIQALKDVIGLNDFTDASTPDARALGATVETAQQSTNNSLFDIIDTDVELLKRLSESVVIRLQDMAEMGLLDRYAMAIGDNSVDFMKRMEHLPNRDFAIDVRPLPTDDERLRLIEEAKAMAGQDMISLEDLVLIKNADDLKEVERLLAYRVRRRKQEKIQESLMLQQQNADVQAQSGIAVEKERQNTAMTEGEVKIKVAEIQAQAAIEVARINAGATTMSKAMAYEAADQEEDDMEEETAGVAEAA